MFRLIQFHSVNTYQAPTKYKAVGQLLLRKQRKRRHGFNLRNISYGGKEKESKAGDFSKR
jgi:hypothetical protein